MVALRFVVLKLGAFLRIVRHGVTTRYYGGCIQQACERRSTLVSLNKGIWKLPGEYSIAHVLSCFDTDPGGGLLALAWSYEVNFNVEDGLGWSPYTFIDNYVS